MSLWLNEAGALIGNGTTLIDCAICPCPGQHISPCNGTTGMPAALTMTLLFNGISIDVRLAWDPIICAGGEGWTYGVDNPDVNICTGLDFRDATLCCGLDFVDTWALELVFVISGGQTSFRIGSGIDPIVIVSDGSLTPLHYTTTLPNLGACSVTDDVLIDIHPAP